MKKFIINKTYFLPVLLTLFIACTDNFEEININPVDPETATIDGIMAGVQYFEFAEPRFVTWRGNLIYTSRFAHQFSYNGEGSWFGGDAYQNNQGWTNAVFDASYQKVSLNIRNLLGEYILAEDEVGAAVTRIMMSWFYQKMTDIFGDVPYSEIVGNDYTLDTLEALRGTDYYTLVDPSPSYDAQEDIYRTILTDLKTQMDAIGSATDPIAGASGDFIYNGDPQDWKAFANTLRLRMALRSRDAFNDTGGNTFIDGVISDCLANPLIDESSEALLSKSPTALVLSFLDGSFEDVYWGFGGLGSKWVFADRFIDALQNNNDPRLFEMADSSANGTYNGSSVLGRSFADRNDLAIPSAKIIGTSTTEVEDILPTQVLTAAESYFLQAEAALLGYGGDAQASYTAGISANMHFWGVSEDDITDFLTNEPIATLSGDNSSQLNLVWNQRWIALLTNGYEAWALVRRTELIPDETDNTQFFVTPPNNGVVPKRLPYSATEAVANEENLNAAVARQGGEDMMTTSIWWDLQ